jgi:hypothetical protein
MKYIITESRLEKSIIDYINKLFPVDEINHICPYDYDEETDEEGEDENRVEFYIGDYDEGDNTIFRWYDCDYFLEYSDVRNRCPIIRVEDQYRRELDGFFNDLWHEPFKKWVMENFDLPIKTVE